MNVGSLCKGEKKEKEANIISFRLNIYILSISKMGGQCKDILKNNISCRRRGGGADAVVSFG